MTCYHFSGIWGLLGGAMRHKIGELQSAIGGFQLRGPAALLFMSRDTCSDSIAKLFRACCCGVSTEWSRYCRKVCWTKMVQTTILVKMILFRTGFQHSRDQNGPKWSFLAWRGPFWSIQVRQPYSDHPRTTPPPLLGDRPSPGIFNREPAPPFLAPRTPPSPPRTWLRIAVSIALLFHACFEGVWDTIAPLSRGWGP